MLWTGRFWGLISILLDVFNGCIYVELFKPQLVSPGGCHNRFLEKGPGKCDNLGASGFIHHLLDLVFQGRATGRVQDVEVVPEDNITIN